MAKSELGKEYMEKDEAHYTDLLAGVLIEQEKKKYTADNALRIFHPQMHGCVKAEFIVNENLPEKLKVGLFKEQRSFPAFMRFSNAGDKAKADTQKNTRGVAIKLLSVPGEKLMESEGIVSTQDFVLLSTPTASPKNVTDNYKGISAAYGGKLKLLGFLLNPAHWYVLKHALTKPSLCPNILEIPFYSTTPYLFGNEGVVKYALMPRLPATSKMPENPSPTFIRERMVTDLQKQEIWYDFKIQFQADADAMPIEDASVEWTSPFITVASVKIPVQSFDDPQQFTFAENLVFNIWHSLPEHKPLGGVNRARKTVYQKLSAYRLQRNSGVTEKEVDALSAPKRYIRSVPDPHLSLWLTAIEETLHKNEHYFFHWRLLDKNDVHPMLKAASAHMNDLLEEKEIPDHPETETDPNDHGLLKTLSDTFFKWAEALREKDIRMMEEMKTKHLKYSKFDLAGWVSSIVTYLEYFKTGDAEPLYRSWKDFGKGDINTSVIEYKLPKDAKVGLIADWGTGTDASREMLLYIMQNHDLDAIIHLGDIYYSGTLTQCQQNFYNVVAEVFAQTNKQIPVFMIPGNHDYYAFGHGFFWLVDAQNPASQPSWKQSTSFFCLRTEDDSWQLLGMDTGIGDYKPQNQIARDFTGPVLKDSEVEWHKDKLDNFSGRTILLSHHQLFSSNNRISTSPPNKNVHLYNVFSPYFHKIGAWLWGHEHTMVIYEDNYLGLAKGRLIGCGSYNDATEEDPYKIYYPEVPYIENMPKLGVIDNYYNHGFAILDFEREKITDPLKITYHQLPVWDGGEKKYLPPDQPYQLFEEEIS